MSEPTEWHLKHRPKTLDRVEGNEAAVAIVKAWFTANKIPHFMLLVGPKGSGKTTIARIIKNQLGCSELDFREINSAMFTGINDIRAMQRSIRIAPANGPCRVILMDEVHRLSPEAQDGALKILEDTPQHVYFILCTTEPHKLIDTLRSRAKAVTTSKLSDIEARRLLERVCKKEGVTFTPTIIDSLVEGADGCARVLMVNAESVAIAPEADREAIAASVKEMSSEGIDLCRALLERKDWREVSKILAGLKGEPETVRRGVLGYCRAVLLKEGNRGKGARAYVIMDCFWKDLYTTGAAGLCYQAFEAVAAKDE